MNDATSVYTSISKSSHFKRTGKRISIARPKYQLTYTEASSLRDSQQ